MATLSTLGQMMLALPPQIQPYNQQELTANRIQLGNIQNRTSLLDLAELRRQLGTQEAARQYQREHPWTVLGGQPPGGAGATALGGIGPAPMPGAGPITQGPLPGMGGQTQTIPGYPDLSRYAAGSPAGGGPLPADGGMPTVTSPPSALASLGPARHPLEGLARRNPDAARLVLAQQQAQETQRLTAQENLLKVRLTEAGAVGQLLQGATAGNWDVVKARVSEIAPQMGARLPQQYSKEAVQPYLDSAVSVKDTAANRLQEMQVEADVLKTRASMLNQQIVPKYTGDAQRDSLIHAEMQQRGLSGNPPQDVLDRVEQRIQQGKIDVSASQGAGQAQQAGQAAYNKERMTQAAAMGSSAQNSLATLGQMETLMNEGVYGNTWGDMAQQGIYRLGLNPGDHQAIRTKVLQEYGNRLIRDVAEGKLGAGVSNKDVDIFRDAVGNFQRAKNLEEMRESLAQMQGAAKRMIGQANRMQQEFQKPGGRLPDFGDESHVQTVTRKDFDAFVAKHPEKTRDQWRRQFTADGLVFRD